MTRDEVIATVQKLLNVTMDRGATEGEAANAAAAAARLLLQHGLSMDDVGTAEEPDVTKEEVPLSTGHLASWQTSIGAGIQIFFNVQMLHCKPPHTRRSSTIIFIGRPTDVKLATWLFSKLQQDLRRRCLIELDRVKFWPPAMRRDFRDSWFEGAALAVGKRLITARRRASEHVAEANALVVRNDRVIADFMSREFGDLEVARAPRAKTKCGEGLLAGARFGEQVSINVNAIEPRSRQVHQIERSQR